MFQQHEGGHEQEVASGDGGGDVREGGREVDDRGSCQGGEKKQGSGEGDRHHVAEIIPSSGRGAGGAGGAGAGNKERDDETLEKHLAGGDGIFAVGVALRDQRC